MAPSTGTRLPTAQKAADTKQARWKLVFEEAAAARRAARGRADRDLTGSENFATGARPAPHRTVQTGVVRALPAFPVASGGSVSSRVEPGSLPSEFPKVFPWFTCKERDCNRVFLETGNLTLHVKKCHLGSKLKHKRKRKSLLVMKTTRVSPGLAMKGLPNKAIGAQALQLNSDQKGLAGVSSKRGSPSKPKPANLAYKNVKKKSGLSQTREIKRQGFDNIPKMHQRAKKTIPASKSDSSNLALEDRPLAKFTSYDWKKASEQEEFEDLMFSSLQVTSSPASCSGSDWKKASEQEGFEDKLFASLQVPSSLASCSGSSASQIVSTAKPIPPAIFSRSPNVAAIVFAAYVREASTLPPS